MIDWISASIPCTHSTPICNGYVLDVDSDGVQNYIVNKRLPVRGSHESNLNVKTDRNSYDPETGKYTHLHIDGNPTKWIQGHNLFGTDNLLGLVNETALRLFTMLEIDALPHDLSLLSTGSFQLHRVDINYSFDLGSQVKVLSFIKAMEHQAHMRHRGAGIMKGKTLYFGQNSRRWSLKMYSKGEETSSKKKGHALNSDLTLFDELKRWADGKLRIEVTLRSLQLKDTGFATASKWEENTPLDIFKTYLEPLKMSNQVDLETDVLEDLPNRLKPVYELWKTGHDLRSSYSSSTFYRHRSALLEYGIDIAVVQPETKEATASIIPFIQIIEDVSLSNTPDWALGTELYFEPRYYA